MVATIFFTFSLARPRGYPALHPTRWIAGQFDVAAFRAGKRQFAAHILWIMGDQWTEKLVQRLHQARARR